MIQAPGSFLPQQLHFIGIKGSGMTALALLLHAQGHTVGGSDIADVFYTDEMLHAANIPLQNGFRPENIPASTEAVVYSAAYTEESNEELAYAMQRYPCLSYPEALGLFSRKQESWAVIGTHGKTSTAALAGALGRSQQLPMSALTGAKVIDFGNNTFFVDGDKIFLAEVCEYRSHFMKFSPAGIILLNIEWDHTDYFIDEERMFREFANFILTLPPAGTIIACVSDRGVLRTLELVRKKRSDLQIIPYRVSLEPGGENEANSYNGVPIVDFFNYQRKEISEDGKAVKVQSFCLSNFPSTHEENNRDSPVEWQIKNPSLPIAWNAAAALLFVRELTKKYKSPASAEQHSAAMDLSALKNRLLRFGSLSRRAELLYHENEIHIVDDYAHHPTAIAATLSSLRTHYRPQRCIVDFMSHTYTRTKAFWKEFGRCFTSADILIINDIYSSAREEKAFMNQEQGMVAMEGESEIISVNGKTLAAHISKTQSPVLYMASFEESADYVYTILQKGDLFITMGAGDNFRVATMVIEKLRARNS